MYTPYGSSHLELVSETIYKHFFLLDSLRIPASNQVSKSHGYLQFFRCGEAGFFHLFIHSTWTSSARNIAVEGYLILCWETCQCEDLIKLQTAIRRGRCMFPWQSCFFSLPDWETTSQLPKTTKRLSLFLIVLMRCCKGATYRVARVNWAVIARSWNASMWADLQSPCTLTAMFS